MSSVRATQVAAGWVGRGGEARAFERVGIDAFARAIDADRDFAFRTRDVSEGGLYLCTRVGHLYPFRVGDELALELHYDGHTALVRGTVVRSVAAGSEDAAHHPEGFAIAFSALELTERAALRALIASVDPTRPI